MKLVQVDQKEAESVPQRMNYEFIQPHGGLNDLDLVSPTVLLRDQKHVREKETGNGHLK